jgi:hypothetical protein
LLLPHRHRRIYTRYEVLALQGEKGERWELLCKLAAQEQDRDKLLELAAAIERFLSEKEERLRSAEKNQTA